MTLLLAALSESAVVLTADGQCKKTEEGEDRFQYDLQKVFPLLDCPLAIAHHGQNIIAGRDVVEIVTVFCDDHRETIAQNGSRVIASMLAGYLDRDSRQTLSRIAGGSGIGFWIAGFGPSRNAGLHEVWWPPGGRRFKLECFSAPDTVWGGHGKDYIAEDEVPKFGLHADAQHLCAHLDQIYRISDECQQENGAQEFGGHKHQLAITAAGCKWIIPPAQQDDGQ